MVSLIKKEFFVDFFILTKRYERFFLFYIKKFHNLCTDPIYYPREWLTFGRVVRRAEAEMPLAEAVGRVSGPLQHGAQQIPRQRDSHRAVLAEAPLQYCYCFSTSRVGATFRIIYRGVWRNLSYETCLFILQRPHTLVVG